MVERAPLVQTFIQNNVKVGSTPCVARARRNAWYCTVGIPKKIGTVGSCTLLTPRTTLLTPRALLAG